MADRRPRRASSNFVFDLASTRGGKRPEKKKEKKAKAKKVTAPLTGLARQAMEALAARRARMEDASK